ncbi:MAG: hypothetical protein HC799_19690 [Limnothrix sp. RL_2_0]|nr:hypothetical protein [Limnothrix sp. RL_2_0]
MTRYYLVDVVSISSTKPRSSYSEQVIDRLARNILSSEVLVRPLLIELVDVESYQVVFGHLEYFAAVRARELDPRKGEMVGAFILNSNNQSSLKEQMEILDESQSSKGSNDGRISFDADTRITNLETRFENSINDLKMNHIKEFQSLKSEIDLIQTKLPERIEPLNAFNSLGTESLVLKLKQARVGEKASIKIANAIVKGRAEREFSSLTDVIARTQGLGDKRMVSIIDCWTGVL